MVAEEEIDFYQRITEEIIQARLKTFPSRQAKIHFNQKLHCEIDLKQGIIEQL